MNSSLQLLIIYMQAHYNKDETAALALFDDESSEDLDDSDEDDTEDEDIQG